MKNWTTLSLVKRAASLISERKVSTTPRLDAELLMAHLLKTDRVGIYTKFDMPLSKEQVEAYKNLIRRRIKGEPVAYITGLKEFFGRKFKVGRGVLIPRPETEELVLLTIEKLKGREKLKVADVGTGSACIAVTLEKELPQIDVIYATEISRSALKYAEENIKRHSCKKIRLMLSSILEGVNEKLDAVVSNPPYVSFEDAKLQRNVKKFEPPSALFGGKDGLAVIRELVRQSFEKLTSGGLLIFEFGYGQAEEVKRICSRAGFECELKKDLSGIYRFCVCAKP